MTNLFYILNPPDDFTRQIPRELSSATEAHVTLAPISPEAGHTSSAEQSVGIPPIMQMDWQSTIGAGSLQNHLHQRPPNPLPAPPTIESSDIVPLQEPEYSILSSIPGVANIPVDSKSATKKRQERRNNNAQSSQRLRDKKRIIAEAAIKKEKEMADRIKSLEETSRQDKERIRQTEERSRQKDAEIERLRRQVEDLQKKK
ncbi:hypothetical protein E4U13_005490 [Claviceps humidiphila]|uniref:BZIP domain-containing protein n=1 Tax=Claviceps humidiphila TaxID=1294629 RepID=A0A9P7TNJ4_9HYPO|nr:hypothetical protein E4U13_005490 [Claviceps humidiphila]